MFRFLVLAVGTTLKQELFFPYGRDDERWPVSGWKARWYKKVRNFGTFEHFSFTTELLEFCSRAI